MKGTAGWWWAGMGAVALALAWLFFFSAHKPPAAVTNYPSSGTSIVAFGDSLVAGSGATAGNDFVTLLSAKIGEPIVNLGRGGDTTADGLARIGAIDRYDPKVVLLLLGGNDYLRDVPKETIFANLAQIIEYIHSRGAIVVLLGVKGSLLGDQFAPEFEALAARYGTAYVPNVLDGLWGNQEFMADAVHPNDAGYRLIAERVYPVLSPLVR